MAAALPSPPGALPLPRTPVIGRAAAVVATAASRAMNNKGDLRAETRERILAAAATDRAQTETRRQEIVGVSSFFRRRRAILAEATR
jgi:hypothetical protein